MWVEATWMRLSSHIFLVIARTPHCRQPGFDTPEVVDSCRRLPNGPIAGAIQQKANRQFQCVLERRSQGANYIGRKRRSDDGIEDRESAGDFSQG
jgi:hypothetical protein